MVYTSNTLTKYKYKIKSTVMEGEWMEYELKGSNDWNDNE